MKDKSYYMVPNPKWHKADRLGKWTAHMSKKMFIGATVSPGVDVFPPGEGSHIDPQPVPMELSTEEEIRQYNSEIVLRPDQELCFQSIRHRTSSLVCAPTGSGKGVIAVRLAEYWDEKTVVILHSKDMLADFLERFRSMTLIEPSQWFGSKKQTESKVLLTTFSSFNIHWKKFKAAGYKNIIRDEADLAHTEKHRHALCMFDAYRVVGFTATIKTEPDDYEFTGQPAALVKFYGYYYEMDDNRVSPLKRIFYEESDSEYRDKYGITISPQKEWIEFRKAMDEDYERKRAQLQYFFRCHHPGDRSLVLVDRVADAEWFYEEIKKGVVGTYLITGDQKKDHRDNARIEFNFQGGVVVATAACISRGWDAEHCNKAFIFYPIKAENACRQLVGRTLRRTMDEKESYIYDWKDKAISFQFQKRKAIYLEFFGMVPEKVNYNKKLV